MKLEDIGTQTRTNLTLFGFAMLLMEYKPAIQFKKLFKSNAQKRLSLTCSHLLYKYDKPGCIDGLHHIMSMFTSACSLPYN